MLQQQSACIYILSNLKLKKIIVIGLKTTAGSLLITHNEIIVVDAVGSMESWGRCQLVKAERLQRYIIITSSPPVQV
jgi:hypothetical protein